MKSSRSDRDVAGAAAAEPVSRGERRWVAAVALVLVIAAAAPIVSGYVHAAPSKRFLGWIPAYIEDYLSLLAWMRQAQDGHLMFRDMFTSEPHGRVILLPLFWVMGTVARVTSAPIVAVWYAVHLLAIVLVVVAVHRFAAAFCRERATRLLALVLAATGSGVGVFAPQAWLASRPMIERPMGLWLVEANLFYPVATSYFVLPLSLAAMLLALLRVLAYLEEGRTSDARAAALWALVVAVVHAYDVVILFAVILSWAVLLRTRRWKGLALVAAAPAPYLLYSLAVVKLDPVLSRLLWTMDPPGIAAHLLGWGLVVPLAAVAVASRRIREENRHVLLLAAWPVVAAILAVLPIDFHRKLIWGAHVPMAVLAAMTARRGLSALADRFRNASAARWAERVAAAALLAVCAAGSLRLEGELLRRAAASEPDEFLSAGQAAGLDWLRDHVAPSDVVMASPAISALIPSQTGATVFWGHWAQTIDLSEKFSFIERMFRDPGFITAQQLRAVLVRNRVRFLVLDARSMRLERLPSSLPDQNVGRVARIAFRNENVAIWEVDARPSPPADRPWDTGSWSGP